MEIKMATIVKKDKSTIVTNKKGIITHHIPAKTTPTVGRVKEKKNTLIQSPKLISYDETQKRYWKGINKAKYDLIYDEETDSKGLVKLSFEEDPNILKSLARSSNTPNKAFAQIAKSEDIHILVDLTKNPNLSSEILDKLARLELSSSEDLWELSRQYMFLKSNIAKNPNTKGKTLSFLYEEENNEAIDPDYQLQYNRILNTALAENENTSLETLHLIAMDSDYSESNRKLFDALSHNPSTSKETLKLLISKGMPYFFGHPNLDADLLDDIVETYGQGSNMHLLGLVANSIFTSTQTIDKLYNIFEEKISPNADYYSGIDDIKTHPNTSEATRNKLKSRYDLAYSLKERCGG